MMDPARLRLRPARAEDDAFLYRLYVSTRADEVAAWGLDPETLDPLLRMQFAGQRGQYAAQFPAADHHIVLLDGRPAGRIYVDRSEERLLLIDVAVLPEYRGQGVGTALLRSLIEEAAALPVDLSVVRTNPARRLYERLGFAVVSEDAVYLRMRHAPDPACGTEGRLD
ncbi:MAG: GNAT family N-acetyltransferase [Rhodothermales bacterium]|nr:GNAT family N-acetyltransferase [Rhodothermales bacterium]